MAQSPGHLFPSRDLGVLSEITLYNRDLPTCLAHAAAGRLPTHFNQTVHTSIQDPCHADNQILELQILRGNLWPHIVTSIIVFAK